MADGEVNIQLEAVMSVREPVKLVIWDLDETFWHGTLSEGGMQPVQANIDLVKALTGRGIINAICSKNDIIPARDALVQLGLWEYFVFPRIAFAPKGAMIAEIIQAAQLRAPSVLFIDDNAMNLREAAHYNPGVQTAGPEILTSLLNDPRCQGKPDPAHERLGRYKVLEQKQQDQQAAGGDNLEFLRASGVRISLHYDVMEQFPRVHDLVNRTNQLNFTKKRWPEDEDEAKAFAEEEFSAVFNSHWGYVKVADRYGSYGICGFFLTRFDRAIHFLFSCRAMNMGVEQFVWHLLGKPEVTARGEVSSSLGTLPDWIKVVEDAEQDEEASTLPKRTLCLRGACDLSMMAHYLRSSFDTIEEYQYPYEGWAIRRVAREIALADEREQKPKLAALLAKTPGMPEQRFASAVHSGAADIYILSFSSELFGGYKKSRSTGSILPLAMTTIGGKSFSELSYQQIKAENQAIRFTPDTWSFMQAEYEPAARFDAALLAADLHCLFTKLIGKQVVVLQLNTSVGNSPSHLQVYKRINETVLPVAQDYGCQIIDIAEFVRTQEDLASPDDPGVHYSREVYQRLAARVEELAAKENAVKPPSQSKLRHILRAPEVKHAQRVESGDGTGNVIEIDERAQLAMPVRMHGNNNRLFIGRNVKLKGRVLEISGDNCSIIINENVNWTGLLRCLYHDTHIEIGRGSTSIHTAITLSETGRITIGEDCMFSNDVRMDVSDMHSILDRMTGQRINKAKDITIGDHVWLAEGVTVAKGCHIGSGSVVGAKSFARGVIPPNVVVAGVPAKIVRENVEWSRKRL